MTRAFALAALLAACSQDVPDPPPSATPTTPVAYRQLQIGDAPIVIATGGVQIVTLGDPLAIGWSGTASDGWAVEPADDVWPNAGRPEYHVRALAAGTGDFAIATAHGIAAGTVASAEAASAAIVPGHYRLDGHSPFAVDRRRPQIEAALYDATGHRLVDGTLAITSPGARAVAWDELALETGVDQQTVRVVVHLTADSIAPADLDVALASGFDRIEKLGSCYHAYLGTTEVAADIAFLGARDPDATNCELAATSRE